MKKRVSLFLGALLALTPAAQATVETGGGGGSVSALPLGPTISNSGGVLNTTQPADRVVTGTTDTILSSDLGKFVDYQNISGVAVSVPAASGASFTQGFSFGAQDQGAGALTLTPAAGFINGVTSFTINHNDGCILRSNSTNWLANLGECPAISYNPTFGTGNMLSLDPRLTATNASTGVCTYVNSSGFIAYTPAGSCAGRVDYDPSTLAYVGVLDEPASSNLLKSFYAVGDANWPTTQVTPTLNNATSPDGTANATLFTITGANQVVKQAGTITSTSAPVTGSVYIKQGTASHNYAVMLLYNTAISSSTRVWMNRATGALSGLQESGTGSNESAVVQTLQNGWYRLSLTYTPGGSDTNITMEIDEGSGANDYSSVVNDTYYEWGGMLEPSAYPTSPIPTTSAPVSRAADNISVTSPYWLNSVTGSVCINFSLYGNVSGGVILSDTATAAKPLYFANSTSAGSYDGTDTVNYSDNFQSAGTLNKSCIAYGAGSSNVALNGTLGTPGTFNNNFGFSGLKFFSDYQGNNPVGGHIQSVTGWSYALSNTAVVAASGR